MDNNFEIEKEQDLKSLQRKLKRKYKNLFKRATDIFLKYNFLSLYDKEDDNADEFDFEVALIISRLSYCKSELDLQSLIFQVFSRMFDPQMAGKVEYFESPARDLWAAWKELRN